MTNFTQRVFSGVQPTGNLHLGNYLGAISQFVPLQDHYPCVYCVVDLHAITVPQDAENLQKGIREVVAAFLAAGIDISKSIIFNQSRVHCHAELAWVFNCVARLGWLERMTQFKEKAGENAARASVGLFTYPNLMAADILAYHATHVPVGEDQKQHLELTRDIAQKFNFDHQERISKLGYGVTNPEPTRESPKEIFFPITKPLITGEAARIMSLRDGTQKMSKSDESDQSRINLTDDAEMIAKKIKRAKTDPEPLPSELDGLKNRPEANNLVGIYAALANTTKEEVMKEFSGAQFSVFKPKLADLAVEKLAPITAEMQKITADPSYIDKVLNEGAEKALAIAEPIMKKTKEILGLN